MRRHVNLILKGDVQGVSFRASSKRKADSLSLRGYVRNNTDGSVLMELEGNNEAVGEFLDWVKSDFFASAHVEISMAEGEVRNFPNFSILF